MLLTTERKRRGWSQAELARRAQLNANTISQVESGRFRPYPSQLRKIARVFGWPKEEADRLLDPVAAESERQANAAS